MVMTLAEVERMCAWVRGPEALNFRSDPDQPDDLDAAERDCDGTHRYTLRWLRANGVDVDANLKLIRELGGCCCDCEVVSNVAAQARWPGQAPLLDDAPARADDLAGDDEALLEWLNSAAFAPVMATGAIHSHCNSIPRDQAALRYS